MGLALTAEADLTVTTSVGVWTATLLAPAGHSLVIFFEEDAGATEPDLETRVDQVWTGTAWIAQARTVGTRVTANDGAATVTVLQLEASVDGSGVVAALVPDLAPSSTIDMSAMDGQEFSVAFAYTPGRTPAEYARMLAALLPPGKLWRLIESTLSSLLLACADELARVDGRAADLIEEADPRTATELLPEYERELGLEAAATVEERRARAAAHTVKRQKFRPADFQVALAPLFGQAPDDVIIIENTAAFAASIGDVREKFRFFAYRDPAEPGDYFVDSAQELVDDMKPSRSAGHVIESIDALYDDEFSLYDRDRMGA